MKIPYKDSRLRIFRYFPCHHGRGEGVLEMMMVDDLGGGGGPKRLFCDDVICEQPLSTKLNFSKGINVHSALGGQISQNQVV